MHIWVRVRFTGTNGVRVETRNSVFRMLKHLMKQFSLCKAALPPSHQPDSKVKSPRRKMNY